MNILELDTLQQYIENNPESSLFPILADRFLNIDDLESAENICRNGLIKFPDFADGYFVLANILLKQNNILEAVKQLQNTIKYNSGSISAHKLLLSIGKENLSLKEIDDSHKIIENYKNNIINTSDISNETLENETLENETLENETLENEKIFPEEKFLENDDPSLLETIEYNENDDSELDLTSFETNEVEKVPEEIIVEEISDSMELEIGETEEDFQQNSYEEPEINNINLEEEPISSNENSEITELQSTNSEEKIEPEEIDNLSLDIEKDNSNINKNDEFDADNTKQTNNLDAILQLGKTNQKEEEDFNLDLESFDVDQEIFHENLENDFELDLGSLSITTDFSKINLNKKQKDEPIYQEPDIPINSDDTIIKQNNNNNSKTNLSIQPVNDDSFEEDEQDSNINIIQKPKEPETPENIPEFKSNLKNNRQESSKDDQKDKINLNIPIPTMTFVEVLKKQKLYDQALEILDLLETRSADKTKIIQQKEEIIQLKVRDKF